MKGEVADSRVVEYAISIRCTDMCDTLNGMHKSTCLITEINSNKPNLYGHRETLPKTSRCSFAGTPLPILKNLN